MANEFYITIDGIRTGRFHGESTNEANKDKIAGLEFFYEVTSPRDLATGQASGKRLGAGRRTARWITAPNRQSPAPPPPACRAG